MANAFNCRSYAPLYHNATKSSSLNSPVLTLEASTEEYTLRHLGKLLEWYHNHIVPSFPIAREPKIRIWQNRVGSPTGPQRPWYSKITLNRGGYFDVLVGGGERTRGDVLGARSSREWYHRPLKKKCCVRIAQPGETKTGKLKW